jgi:hypothetical protein
MPQSITVEMSLIETRFSLTFVVKIFKLSKLLRKFIQSNENHSLQFLSLRSRKCCPAHVSSCRDAKRILLVLK